MRKEKKPETLSNSRDKRTVGKQTKWPAEVAREGLARPFGGTRRSAGAGRRAQEAGGTRRRFSGRPRPAVPTAPSASFHTSPPPAPSVRSREYPRRPDRTCSFLTAPSLPSGRPPHRSPEDPLRSPGPSSARVPRAGHSGEDAPSPGARRVGPGAWAARGSYDPGATRTSGHLARTPARRRGSRSRGSQTRRGRRRGREAWGAVRGAVSRDREKEGSQEEACRAVERRGSGLAGRAGGDRTQRHKAEGVAVRWAGWPRETTKWTEGGRVAPPPSRGPTQVNPTSSNAGRHQRRRGLGGSPGEWSQSPPWRERAPFPRGPDRLGRTEVGRGVANPAPSPSGQSTPRLPAGPRGHHSGGNCGDCGAGSPNCRSRGCWSPAPRGASSPSPASRLPSLSPPRLSPAPGAPSP